MLYFQTPFNEIPLTTNFAIHSYPVKWNTFLKDITFSSFHFNRGDSPFIVCKKFSLMGVTAALVKTYSFTGVFMSKHALEIILESEIFSELLNIYEDLS